MAVTTIWSMWRLSANWAWKSCFSFQNNLKGADWSRHIFVHSATAMALNKIPAMSPSSSSYCGQYDTMYATIGCVLRKAFADDTILGVHREPARIVTGNIPCFSPPFDSAQVLNSVLVHNLNAQPHSRFFQFTVKYPSFYLCVGGLACDIYAGSPAKI